MNVLFSSIVNTIDPSMPCVPCCGGMPSGDVVFSITKAEYTSWVAGGQWLVVVTGFQHETTSAGDIASGDGADTDGTTETSSSCSPSGYVDGSETVHYIDGGVSGTKHYPRAVYFHLFLGISEGVYYAGLSLSMDVYSTGTGGTGQGSVSITFGGHSVSGKSNWTPGWAGRPGYTNTSSYTITVTKLSPPP